MRLLAALLLLLVWASGAAVVASSATCALQDHAEKASPFDGLRWVDGAPEVRVGPTWYRPVAIEGVAVADVLAFCERRWPGQREKRFGEDLVEALELMGTRLPAEVRLDLERVDGGEAVTLERVPATAAKRNAIRDASLGVRPLDVPVAPARIDRAAAEADVREFRAYLEDQFAYLALRGVDLAGETERIVAALPEEVEVAELARALRELLMRCGDGHARVRSAHDPAVERWAPFLVESVAGGFVAFRPDRSALVDAKRPYLVALDGKPLADWLAAVRPGIADGSPQYVRARSLAALRELDLVRRALGLAEGGPVTLTLARDGAGKGKQDVELELATARPRFGAWPDTRSELLTGARARNVRGGVGYLRIPEMDDERLPELRESMREFRETGGLIVDVRGNGGGLRGQLLALAGYLIASPDDGGGPVVINVAAYRASARFPADHLGGSRHLFRADDPHWSAAQRAAIEAFAPTFTPEWTPPAESGGFSAWHYLVLDRTADPDEYHYTAPVVVLCDEHCFSATDIFLAGLAELPGVTLVGQPSGGGSARAEGFRLAHSGIEVSCASMASFRADGRLFDGRGVEVDVPVERAPEDVVTGGGDAQLEAALEVLVKARRR
jgi:hypothetical protein